jgi:cyanate permease
MPDTTALIGQLFRVAMRMLFIAAAVVVLILAKTTDYGWTGPILIVALIALVALVRWSWCAYDKWTREYLAWLNTGDLEAWAAWHRAYVTWSTEHRSRLLGQPPAA